MVKAFEKVTNKKVKYKNSRTWWQGDIATCYADPKKHMKNWEGWRAELGIEDM